MIDAWLEARRARIAAALPPPAFEHVAVWDGAWETLDAPRRSSFRAPAALVSLLGFKVQTDGRGLALPTDGIAPRRATDGAAAPQLRVEVAVTIVTADHLADARALRAADLAVRMVPALIADSFRGIEAENLYGKGLYKAGLSAVALVGHRDIELEPAAPDRRRVGAVCIDIRGDGPPRPLPLPEGT